MEFKKIITSESVSPGHPDKICDQIADEILDECLRQDPNSRVACEVIASNHLIVIAGEITTKAYVDVVKKAWDVLNKIGYSENDFTIISNVNSQSSDLNHIVNYKNLLSAGDQGIVYGYACDETPQLMPLPIVIAHELVKLANELRIKGKFKSAKSDMKSQVSIDYTIENKPKISLLLMSIQHDIDYHHDVFVKFVYQNVMLPIAKKYHLNTDFKYLINPAGKFTIGGPIGDTGLTGRKIIVDTYGGIAHHGGGAFSGKDYTKVDRTGAYLGRWIAKNIVAAKLATICEVQLTYCIGDPNPTNVYLETFGTNKIPLSKIYQAVKKTFDFNLNAVVKNLKLTQPIYSKLSTYGHFGREDLNLEWEKTNQVLKLLENSK